MELGSRENPSSSTFSFNDEDHTLGNSLRCVLNYDPRVEFCGYSVPHPSENRINMRIQTTGAPAKDVLKDALQDLMFMCQHVRGTFDGVVEGFRATEGLKGMSTESDHRS
uniref:DNA-directed RNA polymerases I and III subunit RPAC2 n=1 Tax=Araucaria cunninghamii TaxID=56994 RepID=A0A0D6R8P0_ARACU